MAKLTTTDKVILGGGIAILAGAIIFSAISSSEKILATTDADEASQKTSTKLDDAKLLQRVIADNSRIQDVNISPASSQNFDLFVAPMLFAAKSNPKELVDIYSAAPVHPPVENSWFIKNKLLDQIVKADALSQDPDGDGFTLIEEYTGQTDPNDSTKHPDLLGKLELDDIKVDSFKLIFSMDTEPTFSFKTEGLAKNDSEKEVKANEIRVGSEFGAGNARFKLAKVEKKEFSNSGMTDTENVAFIEDLNPDRKGMVYELRTGSRHAKTIESRSADMRITGGAKQGSSLTVKLGKEFKIPGSSSAIYLLESIDPENNRIVVKPVNNASVQPRIITAAPEKTAPAPTPDKKDKKGTPSLIDRLDG